jgi:hypothetical protein
MKNTNKTVESIEYSFNKVFFGFFAVVYGLAFLINCTGLIYLNIKFCLIWPLFIIFIGLSLFRKKDVISTSLGATITAICMTLVLISFMSSIPVNRNTVSIFPLSTEKAEGIERANINITAGAGEVMVYGIDSGKLINGEVQTNLAEVKIDSQVNNNVQNVDVSMTGAKKWFSDDFKNEFFVGIDKNIPVKINVNSGASNNTINLAGVKAESVVINTGASNVDLTIGEEMDNTDVVIEAGASSINLNLPDTVGVKIFVESGMSSQDLPNFVSLEKNTYQSLNYESSSKKIVVNVKMGMTSLNVNWYQPEKKAKIVLYYYNQADDKDNTCGLKFVKPIEREISVSGDIIKQTVDLLIQGNLTKEEIANGFVTEYPNSEFKLLKSNLDKNGTLALEFTEVPGFTSGGSCRVGILTQEILKTVRQFPEVKKIELYPDSLFQP